MVVKTGRIPTLRELINWEGGSEKSQDTVWPRLHEQYCRSREGRSNPELGRGELVRKGL